MAKSFFYNLGRKVGPKVRKARWVWESLTGTDADAIRIEQRVGLDLAREARAQLQIDDDLTVRGMLDDVGLRLGRHVADKRRLFQFEAFRAGEPNAFALPGGFVFVSRSILTLCQADANQVAFILAHEISHVLRGHAIERIVANSAISAVSRTTPAGGILGPWLQRVGVRFLETAYSRDQELDADRLAIRLMAAAGYDPWAGVTLLENLAGLNEASNPLSLGRYFSTHPSFDVRIDSIRRSFGAPSAPTS